MKMRKNVDKHSFKTQLKTGDTVMVVAGGNKLSGKKLKGEVGKILRLLPKRNRVIVEGVNVIKRHRRARNAQESSGIIAKEGSVHVSNVRYYSEAHKRPVRLSAKVLEDGRKVRGFKNPETNEFEQIDL